jgi:hypothetical protein
MHALLKSGLVVGILFVGGCGGSTGPATFDISGKVSIAGKPVEDGLIRFVPAAGTPAHDPNVAPIKQGAYTAKVTAGKKRVEVESFSMTGPEFDGKPTMKQIAPEKYNTKSGLTAEIQAGMTAPLDFSLE